MGGVRVRVVVRVAVVVRVKVRVRVSMRVRVRGSVRGKGLQACIPITLRKLSNSDFQHTHCALGLATHALHSGLSASPNATDAAAAA
jgi:hypothetical protein